LKITEIPALTGLRFVAAFSILLGHTVEWTSPFTTDTPIFHITAISIYGMPLFFVLSGFVIHLNYARHFQQQSFPVATSVFFVARFARLYPLYLFFFVFGLISDFTFHWIGEFPDDFLKLLGYGLTMTQSWVYILVINKRLLLENAFGLGWSVSTEWFFYIAYLGLVFLLLRLKTARASLICAGAFSFGCFVALIEANAHYHGILALATKYIPGATMQATATTSFYRWFFYYSPYIRVLEFVLGCLTAQLYVQLAARHASDGESKAGTILLWGAILVLAAIGIVFAVGGLPPLLDSYFHFLVSNFGCAVPIAIVIFCVSRYPGPVTRLLSSWPAVRLGDISYSIYAVHTWTLRPLIRPAAPYDAAMIVDAAIRIPLGVIFTIIVATAFYRFIEVPCRAYIRSRLSPARVAWRSPEVTAAAAPAIAPPMKHANVIRLVAVNLLVLFVLLGGIAFYFRISEHEKPDGLLNGLSQTPQQRPDAGTAPAVPAVPADTEAQQWNFFVGLTVTGETAVEPVVAGFQPRRLTATPTDTRHGLGVHFDDLKPGGTYHVTVWLKSAPNTWAMLEGRDSNDPLRGRPAHYGVASYDLAQATLATSSGDLTNMSVAPAKDGWVKVVFDLVTKDGQIFVTANILEGSNGHHVFHGAGQSIVFGGVEIDDRN
jgi:peptidoglycan/LPS O-acetylase OafA/YrhL